MSTRQTHAVLELRMTPSNPHRPLSVVYCNEVRFWGTDSVISVQDDGVETLHSGIRSASVTMGRSL